MRSTTTRRWAAVWLGLALVASACTKAAVSTTTVPPTPTTTAVSAPAPAGVPEGEASEAAEAPAVEFVDLAAVRATAPVDPVLSHALGTEVRVPNSVAAFGGRSLLQRSDLEMTPLLGATSVTGNEIENLHDPLQDLELALYALHRAAREAGDAPIADLSAAAEAEAILTGTTSGRLYDGFALLNYNRGAWAPGHVEGEYKMKELTDTGETFVSEVDGQVHRMWEVTINMLWYGQNFDSDTYLLRIPYEADRFDQFRINWRIYSLIQEDLAPTFIMNDGFGRIFQGFDSTFLSLPAEMLSEVTIEYPPLVNFRGMYIWGWGVHPPRVQFLQPVREIDAEGHLDPAGLSFATRTRENLTLDAISPVAPEMKAYRVVQAALGGATGDEVAAMLDDPAVEPRGTYREWLDLAADLRRLPPEAWDVLAAEEGLAPGDYGDYDIILAYANNEIYGETPYAAPGSESIDGVVADWAQGDTFKVKVINLDRIVHYYRNVDFSAPLSDEMERAFGNGAFSFERFSPKPTYGVPKVAEMQWRTGWGFVPHMGIRSQPGLFPRPEDRRRLTPFLGQLGDTFYGYVFENASDYWRFDPPAKIREGERIVAGEPLREADGSPGVLIGTDTEGFGVAKMPTEPITTHPDQENFAELTFPGFLRNPDPKGGDIIPPTPVWAPFLTLDPRTGTLQSPDGSYWVDQTYFHGRPVPAGESIVAHVEAPRSAGQLFYQFDPLFHDNMIFSYHPRSDTFD